MVTKSNITILMFAMPEEPFSAVESSVHLLFFSSFAVLNDFLLLVAFVYSFRVAPARFLALDWARWRCEGYLLQKPASKSGEPGLFFLKFADPHVVSCVLLSSIIIIYS